MSFSKARLRRFNEEIPQVPSPGRYDPKVDSTVKGAVMPTSKRFPGQTITSSSLDNIDKASTASSGIVFRTPQLMKKVALTPRIQHLKDKKFDTSGSDILSSEERPTLKSSTKTVSKADYKRLENELQSFTDKYYKMLLDKEMEVNVLRQELNETKIHEAELKEVLEEKIKLASDRQKETLLLKDNLDTMVEKINVDREEHQRFINELKLEISELQNKKYELETVLAEKQSVIVTINDKYSDLEYELKSLQEENMMLGSANSCILKRAEEKFQQLENDVFTKLHSFQKSFDAKFEDEQQPLQTKMNYFLHESRTEFEEKIAQVKESQNKVQEHERLIDKKVKEFSKYMNEADEGCKYLFRELRKVEEERSELLESDLEKKLAVIDIQEKSESCHIELEECRNTCRKYQITLNTMNQTIKALSTRLMESEEEVERLNSIEKDLKLQKHQLEEKSQLLHENIITLRESIETMEEEIIRDVSAIKSDLEAKADLFKEEAVKAERFLNDRILENQSAIDILLKENEYFKKEVERKDELIEGLKNREKEYEKNINKLKLERSKVEEELSEKLCAQKNLHVILSNELQSANNLINDLKSSKTKHESQISSLLKQLKELGEASVVLERVNSEQSKKIESLQSDIESKQEMEIKQKQYIDEMISDLVLEKERCEAVEAEKEKIERRFQDTELTIAERVKEIEKLHIHVASLKQRLRNCEEKISLGEDEKELFKEQLIFSEKNLEELKLANSIEKKEMQSKITELQCQLTSAKETIKTEIPKLERDNINKAENILELNLSIDTLKEEMELQITKISCLEAEKTSLNNVLEEIKSKVCDLQQIVEDKNLAINILNEENVRKDALCQDLLSQFDSMSAAYNKQNEELKQNAENTIKLIEAEERISELELQLTEKDKEVDLLSTRVVELKETLQLDLISQLKEELEELRMKYNAAVDERDKLNHEVGELLGHQNIHQKIKRVSELKQHCLELKDENDKLKVENLRLKTKLENSKKPKENKENVSIPRREETQKISKQGSAKKQMAPAVLKQSNH